MKTSFFFRISNNTKGTIFTESVVAIPAFFLIIFGLVELSSYLIFRNTVTSALTRAASLAAIVQGLDSNDWPTHRDATLAVRKLAYEGMTGLIVREESSTAPNRLVAPSLETRQDKALWPSELPNNDPIFTKYTPIEVILPPLNVEEKQLFKTSWGAGVMRKKMRVEPIRIATKVIYSPLLLRWLPFEATIAEPLEFHVSAFREVVNTDVEPAALDCNGEELRPNSITVCPCLLTDPNRVYDSQGQCVCKPGYTEDVKTSKCICAANSYVDSNGDCKPCSTCHTAAARYYDENGMCGCCASPLLAYSYWAVAPPATSNYSSYPTTTTTSIRPPEKCYCPRDATYCSSTYGRDYIFNLTTCGCDKCPTGLYRTNSDTVMCSGCYTSWDGQVPQSYSQTWNGCSCDIRAKADACPGSPIDQSTCQCKAACDNGMTVSGDKLKCVCDVNAKAATCPGSPVDAATCLCKPLCPDFMNVTTDKLGCVCDVNGRAATCPGAPVDTSTCLCKSPCGPGMKVTQDKLGCICDPAALNCGTDEFVQNNTTSCECVYCPPPKVPTFNTQTRTGTCICDQTALGLYCQSIGAGPAIDSSSAPCTCQAGCPEGTVLSNDGRYCACLVDGNGNNTCPSNNTTMQSPTSNPQCACALCANNGTGNQTQLWPVGVANPNGTQQYSSGACSCGLTSAICKTQLGSPSAMLNYINCTCTDPCKTYTCTGNGQPLPAIDSDGIATCNCQGE